MPGWRRAIEGEFNAVLTATALHWLPEERLGPLYAEIAGVLVPGGVFCNADHMPDPGLPGLTTKIEEVTAARREAVYARGEALSWPGWWDAAREDPTLVDAVVERDAIFGDASTTQHSESLLPVSVHLDLLRRSGFREVGLVWRGLLDAAFAALT